MRIVIDMQGAQTDSRFRGIGRYTVGIAKAIARNRGKHEVLLALSSFEPETIDTLRAEFKNILPQENIRVWYAPGPVAWISPANENNRKVAEIIYEEFILSLCPDILFIPSLFEGFGNDAVFSPLLMEKEFAVIAVGHDLIPYQNPNEYLSNKAQKEWYMYKFSTLIKSKGIVTHSQYTRSEFIQCLKNFNGEIVTIGSDVDNAYHLINKEESSVQKFLADNNITKDFILYAGGVEPRKNVPALIKAYSLLPRELRFQHQLVLVCGIHEDQKEVLQKIAAERGLDCSEYRILGYLPVEQLCVLYNTCKLFVFPSLSEGFGLPLLEAMRCGAPVIGSDATSIPEVINNPEALFNPHDVKSMSFKMEQSLRDDAFRQHLQQKAREQQKKFSWDLSAQRCFELFEKTSQAKTSTKEWAYSTSMAQLCSRLAHCPMNSDQYVYLAQTLGRTFETSNSGKKQLFVDISELYQRDAKTGIQRVTRSVLAELLHNPPPGYIVRPVFARAEIASGYFHAQKFITKLSDINVSELDLDGCPIDYNHDDFFLGLDYLAYTVPLQIDHLIGMHRHGVKLWFVVYDLLPILFPTFWGQLAAQNHSRWLKALTLFDGVVCISSSVANELKNWLNEIHHPNYNLFPIKWFHLGNNIECSMPTMGLPQDAQIICTELKKRTTILMVSTIEPRKGYLQALDAFELLWHQKIDINLAIVGKAGWNMDAFIKRLNQHQERGKHLFWLSGISDEYLKKVYDVATAVLMASAGEGFGLAVVEGALHGKPLILRDLPVFREIAGDHAFYFNGEKPEDLATAIEKWLKLYKEGKAPSSEGVETLTWKESTQMLLKQLPL